MARTKKQNGEGSTRQLESGKWECIVTSRHLNPKTLKPKRIKRVADTEADAVKAAKTELARWEKDIVRGIDTKEDKTKTFGQYMDEYIETEVKPNVTASTYHSYVNTMNRNFHDFRISKLQLKMLNAFEFEQYYSEILKLKSKKTCSFPIQLSKRCCQWLVDKSLLDENYALQARVPKDVADEYDRDKELKLQTRKKVFTPEDIQKFYDAFRSGYGEYPVVVLFLLETGMRCSEFASLRNDNIDMDKGIIHIVETRGLRYIDNDKTKGLEEYVKVPKNNESRFVVISDLCRECIQYMRKQTELYCKNNPDNLLYPTFRNGKRRSNASMENSFKHLCTKLEIDRDLQLTKTGQMKGLSLHSLRHTADTMANTAKDANVL